MKFIIGTLLAGGTLVTGSIPNPSNGQCIMLDIAIEHAEPTVIDPEPAATSARIYQVCGFQVPNSSGGMTGVDDMFWTEIDVEQAEVLVQAAVDLLNNGDVFLSQDG